MKKTTIFILSTLMLTGCGTYSRYHRAGIRTENLYWNLSVDIDTTNIASMSWREMFTDRELQSLIEAGLEQNTDLNVARLRVEAAEAALMTAKLSYLPSLGINAEGGGSRYDGATAKTYNVGATASWELDIFGSIRQRVKAQRETFQASREEYISVQVSLCAQVASAYINLRELQQELQVVMHNCRTQEEVLNITEVRYNTGLVSKLGSLSLWEILFGIVLMAAGAFITVFVGER